MTVTCEEIEYCKIKASYVADPDVVEEKTEEVVKKLKAMKLKVPGFRQSMSRVKTKRKSSTKRKSNNKKPTKNLGFKNSVLYERALVRHYKSYIEDNVKKELVSEGIDETIFEWSREHGTKMHPIGYPKINNLSYDGDTFSCEMLFLKKPDFELGEYKGFEIPKPHSKDTTESTAAEMIQELRIRHGDVVPYEENDFLQEGDQVTVDIRATADGEDLEHLTRQGILYTVGSQTYGEFDQNLYGMKAGEHRKFDIVFPEDDDTVAGPLKGKKVTFDVDLHMGTKRIPHPLDDELAKKMGLDNYDILHQEAMGAALTKLKGREMMLLTQQVTTRLLEHNEFEVPSWLVLMESQNTARKMGKHWHDLSMEEVEAFNANSKKSVKLSMILDSVREADPESVFSTQEIIDKLKNQIASQGQDPVAVLTQAEKDGTLLGEVTRLRDEATVQWILDNSKIIE